MIEKRFWPAKILGRIPQLKQGGFPGFSRKLLESVVCFGEKFNLGEMDL